MSVKRVYPTGITQQVYDITVDIDHNFLADGVIVHNCPPSVQAALLRMVLDGALGDYTFPKGVRFIAAANPTADAAGGWELTPPLANRFGHIPWETPTVDEWCTWLIDGCNGGDHDDIQPEDPEAIEARVLSRWDVAFAKAKGLYSAFMKARPELFFRMPDVGSSSRTKAWPSPRTHEMAIRAIAGADVHGADEMMGDQLVAAFVGAGVAAELTTYRKNFDLPNPADVLDGKVKFKHSAKRLDRTIAVLTSCTALVCSKGCPNLSDRIDRLWEVMGQVGDQAIDIVVPSAEPLCKRGYQFKVSGKRTWRDPARKLMHELGPVVTASGYMASRD